MNAAAYASKIKGLRFLGRKELEQVATVWAFQVSTDFDQDSARSVFRDLPDSLELSCVALEEKDPEEAYAFVRRVGSRLMLRRGGHGWLSEPKETDLERAVQILIASPFVKKPDARFESFRVTQEK